MATRNGALGSIQFNPYGAGAKKYGMIGTDAATIGPVDNAGYQAREQRKRAQRNALQQSMRQNAAGNPNGTGALRWG